MLSSQLSEGNALGQRQLKVLCLGLPRSGTDSLKKALNHLGYDFVYHGFVTVFDRPTDILKWRQLSRAKWNLPGNEGGALDRAAFDQILGDCDAVTDVPCCFFPQELMQAYPEAKVVLNYREYESWNTSFQRTIEPMIWDWSVYLLSWVHPRVWHELDFWVPAMTHFWQGNTKDTRRRYDEHHALVRGLAFQQKRPLLEWKVQDGWQPLCDFLEVPVPDTPFPTGNTQAEFQTRVLAKKAELIDDWVKLMSPVAIFAATAGAVCIVGARLYR